MPTKTHEGKPYRVTGKKFVWTTEDGAEVSIPLRLKLRVIRSMADRDMDASAMFDILGAIIPGQEEVLDDMDVNDFQSMFLAWQTEYNALAGATPGE